ncbi:hypothetical protein Tco_0908601 [Tanacetum coccineum]|uniref:SPX domain-containing protein n=1 Tax=Tanacetum coccineum TaxID=301880 RepID=A0ABQ5CMN2_9ASTR
MTDTLSSCSDLEEEQMQQIQGTRTERGFKRDFTKLFRQDDETFTGTMFLNMDQLEKQLDKEEFQEIRSMAAFRVLETQCQKFIKSRISLDDEDGIMTRMYFLEYTQLEGELEIQMQTKEGKVDTSKALDANLVVTESSRTESGEQDTCNSLGIDADVMMQISNPYMTKSQWLRYN